MRSTNYVRVVRVVLLLVSCVFVFETATAHAQTGADLYGARCASCHGEQGEGRGSFPSLVDNPVAGNEEETARIVREGIGNMPAFTSLSPAEIDAIAEYVASAFAPEETGPDAETDTTTPAGADDAGVGDEEIDGPPDPTADEANGDLPQGSAARGRAYFVGETGLAEGGAACVSCHGVADAAGIPGGSLASDLSTLNERYGGPSAVAGALADPAFPLMDTAYEDRPLTTQERADLAAFFAALPDSGETAMGISVLSPFWIPGALGTILLFVLAAFLWPRNRTTAIEQLRAGSAAGRTRLDRQGNTETKAGTKR